MKRNYTVAEAAAATGLTPRAVRWYDVRGLVVPAHRTGAGHRRYDEQDIARLRFVRVARDLGLSLDHIAEVLMAARDEGCACPTSRRIVSERLGQLNRLIDELTLARDTLTALLLAAPTDGPMPGRDGTICPLIEGARLGAAS